MSNKNKGTYVLLSNGKLFKIKSSRYGYVRCHEVPVYFLSGQSSDVWTTKYKWLALLAINRLRQQEEKEIAEGDTTWESVNE